MFSGGISSDEVRWGPVALRGSVGAPRVAGVPDASGLRLALGGTSIHVGCHREFTADRVPDLLADGRHRVWLGLGAQRLVADEVHVPEQSIVAIPERLAAIAALPAIHDTYNASLLRDEPGLEVG